MVAVPADIARFTNDGILVTSPRNAGVSAAIQAEHVDARGMDGREIEMFYDDAVDAQFYLDERFGFLSRTDPLHVSVEVEESLGIGDTVPIAPLVPAFRAIDATTKTDVIARTRAYAQDMSTDRFGVELLE